MSNGRMVKIVFKLFSILPLSVNHFIGKLIGNLLYLTGSKSKIITEKNIHKCFPKLKPKDQSILVKNSLIEDGKTFTELGYIWCKTPEENLKKVVSIKGSNLIPDDDPVIFIIPHFGCWELSVRMASANRKDKTTILYKPLNNPKHEDMVLSYRQFGGIDLAKTDKSGVRKLHKALAGGKSIGILPDQDPGNSGSVVSNFFNVEVRTMTLLARLSLKSKADLIMVSSKRLKNGRGYEVEFSEINSINADDSIERRVSQINKNIESLVKENPEQYLWNYKRFKNTIRY